MSRLTSLNQKVTYGVCTPFAPSVPSNCGNCPLHYREFGCDSMTLVSQQQLTAYLESTPLGYAYE